MQAKANILLVDDHTEVNDINREALEDAGYNVLVAETLEEAAVLLAVQPVELIVLDVMLPDGNGLSFCRRLREDNPVPILFLTALGEKDQRISGLQAGGDDYLTKPYHLDELCARVAALLRRVALEQTWRPPFQMIQEYGPIRLDFTKNKVCFSGREVRLAPREFLLLYYLIQQRGEVVSPDRLYQQVWGESTQDAVVVLRVYINTLRRKLRLSENHHISLETEYGKGYRLNIQNI